MPYWILTAGYVVAALLASVLIRRPRWLVLVATAVVGVLTVMPLRCLTHVMPMCTMTGSPGGELVGECRVDDAADCTTVFGAAVPFELAAGWTFLVGAGLVTATVLLAAVVGVRRRQATRDRVAPGT